MLAWASEAWKVFSKKSHVKDALDTNYPAGQLNLNVFEPSNQQNDPVPRRDRAPWQSTPTTTCTTTTPAPRLSLMDRSRSLFSLQVCGAPHLLVRSSTRKPATSRFEMFLSNWVSVIRPAVLHDPVGAAAILPPNAAVVRRCFRE